MWNYPIVNPSLIENTTMQKGIDENGVHRNYLFTPIPGYVIHDNESDYMGLDPVTGEDVLVLGYTRGTVTCGANYNFTANPREFYAVPESDVPDPENQIFGGGGNHEIMSTENGETETE